MTRPSYGRKNATILKYEWTKQRGSDKMKTPEEMRDFFRSMPAKKKDNPYWVFTEEPLGISSIRKNIAEDHQAADKSDKEPFDLAPSIPMLKAVREFFRRYYESFRGEAQVLCVPVDKEKRLSELGIPVLTHGMIGPFEVSVVVLPQNNSSGNTVISEKLWQERIVGEGIIPVARIHSHYTLGPYQSMTDYSTLNSGTLEMVMGHILENELNICYWLDVPGTDTKAQTFVARQKNDVILSPVRQSQFEVMPFKFNGPDSRLFGRAAEAEECETPDTPDTTE